MRARAMAAGRAATPLARSCSRGLAFDELYKVKVVSFFLFPLSEQRTLCGGYFLWVTRKCNGHNVYILDNGVSAFRLVLDRGRRTAPREQEVVGDREVRSGVLQLQHETFRPCCRIPTSPMIC